MNPDYIKTGMNLLDGFINTRSTGKSSMGLKTAIELISQSSPAGEFLWIDVDDYMAAPPSVLESSEIGKNLHSLLEQADHPLTNTALAYIRELEEKITNLEETNNELQTVLRDANEKKLKAQAEANRFKSQTYHPARRR